MQLIGLEYLMTEFFFQQENEDLVKKINEEKEKANTEFKRLETQIQEVSGKFFHLWGGGVCVQLSVLDSID